MTFLSTGKNSKTKQHINKLPPEGIKPLLFRLFLHHYKHFAITAGDSSCKSALFWG